MSQPSFCKIKSKTTLLVPSLGARNERFNAFEALIIVVRSRRLLGEKRPNGLAGAGAIPCLSLYQISTKKIEKSAGRLATEGASPRICLRCLCLWCDCNSGIFDIEPLHFLDFPQEVLINAHSLALFFTFFFLFFNIG